MEKVDFLSLSKTEFYGAQHACSSSKTRFNVKLINTKQTDI